MVVAAGRDGARERAERACDHGDRAGGRHPRAGRDRPPLPEFPGATLNEAVPLLQAAGVRVITFDARWHRQVASDWRICTQTPTFHWGGQPTGDVHLAAVPPGDPCG